MMEEFGQLQELLDTYNFYNIDSKIDEVARALGLAEIGTDRDVSGLSSFFWRDMAMLRVDTRALLRATKSCSSLISCC